MNFIFCLVSLVGAFLLFQVQPVISKFILPWFGGSPGVWTTCMLFFQVVLFGGYTYAHFLAQRRPRAQAVIHIGMLVVAACLLPIVPSTALKPTGAEEPVWRILFLLLRTVGLPYFILSATSPLVQVWFSHRFPSRSPWRLYSLSNIGSLTALLSYPVLIETRWDVMAQTHIWSWLFVVFAVLMAALAYSNQKRDNQVTPEGDLHPHAELHQEQPTWLRRAKWLLLPGFASVTLLATTNHVCQDVAVIPFLWVVPLSLYLISFIICFDHPRWYVRSVWALPAMVFIFLASGLYRIPWENWFNSWSPDFVTELAVYFGAMFLICMVCHGELAKLKPGTRHLTEYYLLMSAGGALGGLAVSVVAPLVFKLFLEWSLALLVGFVLVTWVAYRGFSGEKHDVKTWRWRIAWLIPAVGALALMSAWEFRFSKRLERARNFYGVLATSEFADEDTGERYRSFIHGSIVHGRQSLTPSRRRDPLTYFGHDSGIGQTLDGLKSKPNARVGVIGMGAGTVACYAEAGQTYRFYEINPLVEQLALRWFSFIPDMKTRGANYESVLGDARLMLEHESPQQFDVLFLDAFSGDSVPVHLLTREAFDVYLHHLKPDGVIVVNIINAYLNLAPVVERVGREHQLATSRISHEPKTDNGCFSTDFLLMSRDKSFIQAHPPVIPKDAQDIPVPLWTDHRHNLFQILQKR